MNIFEFIIIFILLAVFAGIIFYILKKGLKSGMGIILNTVLGFIAMFLLNVLGIHIPITILTLIIAAIFGLLGVAVMAFLAIFGML